MNTLRYAWRSLARSKGFVTVAVLALGLGLGLSTTMFAVLDAIVNPYVAYRDPESLFAVRWWYSVSRGNFTQADLFRAVTEALDDIGTVVPIGGSSLALETADDSREMFVARVGPEFFEVTGVIPRLGRPFSTGEDPHVIILSDGVWRRLFGNRSTLQGAAVSLGGATYTVVGVMPRGSIAPGYAGAWIPARYLADDATAIGGRPFVRLNAGVTKERGDAVLKTLSTVLTERFANRERPISVELAPVMRQREEIRDIHKAMVGAALGVLIIACVNLAHLMLARGMAKRRELALRMALGASRAVVVRQMFAECAIITVAGAALGAVGAIWGADVLTNRMPREINWIGLIYPQLSWRVFALSAFAAVLSAVLFGLLPAIRVALGVNLDEPLKDGAGTTTRQRGRYSLLVIAEVALALVLMMGGGLLLRTIHQMKRIEFTFDARTLIQAQVGIRGGWRDTSKMITRDAFMGFVRDVPGVREVAIESGVRTRGGALTAEMTDDSTRTISAQEYSGVSWQYLRVHGLPIVQGRDFEPGDASGNGVAIVNAVAAQRLYPRGSAVGRMIKLGAPPRDAPWIPIVGVVRNAAAIRGGDDTPTGPEVYVARPDGPTSFGTLLIRTDREDPRISVAVRRKLHAVANVWVYGAEPYTYLRDAELISRRFLAKVFVTMGTVALALSALGLYGVLAYAVGQRMREFSVRLALGAQPAQLFKMVMHDGAVMILAGTGIGAFGALAASRLLNSVLTSVLPSDVISLVACEIVLMGTGFLAALTPARRAIQANPMDILRAV